MPPPTPTTAEGSQFGQDRFLDTWVFEGRRGGVFLDIGAYDGVTGSNTVLFERSRGWTGLLVEPSPVPAAQAATARAADIVEAAAGREDGMARFRDIVEGYRQMSGLERHHSAEVHRMLRSHPSHREETIDVAVMSPRRLVDRLDVDTIDLVCIDIEGAEVEVLEAFPFDEVRVGAWCIENNDASTELESLMAEHGHGLVRCLGVDEIYVPFGRVEAIRAASQWSAFDEALELLDARCLPQAAAAWRRVVMLRDERAQRGREVPCFQQASVDERITGHSLARVIHERSIANA